MNILKNYVLVIFFATLVSFLAVSNKSIANSDNQEKLYEKRLINAVEARDFTKVKTLLTTALGKKIVQKPIGSKMAGMAIDKGYFKIRKDALGDGHSFLHLYHQFNDLSKEDKENWRNASEKEKKAW